MALRNLQSELLDLQSRARELEQASKKASRGIYSRYDFNGVKREVSGGSYVAIVDKETTTFQRLVELERQRDYDALFWESVKAIRTTPEWLTPYLFRGIAQANLGDREGAKVSLEYVIDNAPGDPEYAQAEELLRKLKEQERQ
jgi:hypothetical protein